jgi:uncharacterized protein Yka (UPF0111/DUF47 family)
MPRQDKFYTQFLEFAQLLEEASAKLHKAFGAGASAMKDAASAMLEYEKKADTLGMQLFTDLHKSFITPFDPEDIFAFIHNLDDVMDGMEDVAHRADAYGLSVVPQNMVKLASIIHEGTRGITVALTALKDKKNVIEACLVLKEREAEVDAITRTAIGTLFREEKDAVLLLKQKEIYEYFEATGDALAHVATILGRIQIKGG